MPKIDNEKFYTSAIQKYGTTAKGVNWTSSSTQKIRFKIILELLPKNLTTFSLIDAGCGFGDLYTYMQKKTLLPKSYIGIDAIEDMYTIASENTGCEIIIADITQDDIPSADFIVCSGAMNVLDDFETHLFIRNCYESSEIGFIFNILHGEIESQTYNYLTTQEIQDRAKGLGVKNLVFKTGYLEDDITVGFFK